MNRFIKETGAHICLLLSAASISLQGILFGRMVDILYQFDSRAFRRNLELFAVLLLAGSIAAVVSRRLIYSLTGVRMKKIRTSIFHFDLRNKSEFEISDYTTNADMLYTNVLLAKWNIFSCVYAVIFALAAMIQVNPLLLIVGVLVSFSPLLVTKAMGNIMQKKVNAYMENTQEYQGYIIERLAGRHEINQYQVTDVCETEHEQRAEELEAKRQQLKNASNYTKVLNETFANISFFVVIAVGGYLAFQGKASVGGVITVIQLLNYTVEPLVNISDFVKEKKGCISIVEKFDKKEKEGALYPETNVAQRVEPQTISLENVSFSYNNEEMILKDFSVTFEKGKKYLVRGESGAGKTTLGELLSGELEPVSGMIKIDGQDISKFEDGYIYNLVRKVNQKAYVYSATVNENVKFLRELPEGEVEKALDDVRLQYLSNEQTATELSGGEQERITIARSLISPPGIVIYDEPTAALDEKNSCHIMERITKLDSTVICISHNISEEIEKMFDEVIVL